MDEWEVAGVALLGLALAVGTVLAAIHANWGMLALCGVFWVAVLAAVGDLASRRRRL